MNLVESPMANSIGALVKRNGNVFKMHVAVWSEMPKNSIYWIFVASEYNMGQTLARVTWEVY